MAFGAFARRPNLVLLITDPQSAHPYWPPGWQEEDERVSQPSG